MNDSFRNSEWGPEAAEALAREVRMFKVPGGKNGNVITLGDYIDKTPRDLMSKVMLKEIVFDTWYDGQTVLLGDGKQLLTVNSDRWRMLMSSYVFILFRRLRLKF